MFHPGTVVFPAVFAAAQQVGARGEQFLVASVMGYEVAIRTGIFLGPAHYEIFHTTGTAGMVGAAAGVARVLGLSAQETLHALGTAGTQAAALWEFLRDGADSKILHSGKAAANGVLSAFLARDGFTGASQILEGKQGLAAGLSRGPVKPEALTEGLRERWKILECTYKPYACCRHTHPSADALRVVIREHGLTPDDIEHVTAHVHRGAVDVLGQVVEPATVYQSKFSLGFVLALAAYRGRAGAGDFNEESLHDPRLRAFARRVEMVLDPMIPRDASRRPGRVVVTTRDGKQYEVRIAGAKGDPGNSMSRVELEEKVQSLAEYSGRLQPNDVRRLLDAIWNVRYEANLDRFTLPVANEI
jgi:2-methylcitrate dehydratase PrpD